MRKGRALRHDDGRDAKPMLGDSLACIIEETIRPRWRRVQDHESRLTGDSGDVNGRADRLDVKQSRTAGNEDKVRSPRRGERVAASMGGRIYEDEVGTGSLSRPQSMGEAGRRNWGNRWPLAFSEIPPCSCARLRIEVDHDSGKAGELGRDS